MANSDSSVNEIFSLIDEDRIYEFAKLYAQKHKTFADALRKHFAKDLLAAKKVVSLEELKKMVDKCLTRQYGDSRWSRRYNYEPNFYDWEEVEDGLLEVIKKIDVLINNGLSKLAIDGSFYMLEKVCRCYDEEFCYDREDISAYNLRIDDALKSISNAFKDTDLDTQYKLEVIAKLETMSHYDAFEIVSFDTAEFIESARKVLMTDEERIALREDAFRNAKDISMKEIRAKDLWNYLMELNRPQQAIELFHQNKNLKTLRTCYISYLMDNNRPEEALAVIDEGLRSTWASARETIGWQHTKLDILQKQGNMPAVIAQLTLLFYEDNDTLKYYRQLKKLIPADEWTAFITNLLKGRKKDKIYTGTLSEIYVSEKWYDKLYENLLSEDTYLESNLEKYAKYLPEEQQTMLVKRLEPELRNAISSTMTRDRYREYTTRLIKLRKTCTPGRVLADSIVAYCRQTYTNRPALLDELKRYDK